MIAIRNVSGRLWSPGLLYDRSRSWSRSSTALYSSQPEMSQEPARVLKQNWRWVMGVLDEFDEGDQNKHLRHVVKAQLSRQSDSKDTYMSTGSNAVHVSVMDGPLPMSLEWLWLEPHHKSSGFCGLGSRQLVVIQCSVRLRSHWHEYESRVRVRVSVYGSYKLTRTSKRSWSLVQGQLNACLPAISS